MENKWQMDFSSPINDEVQSISIMVGDNCFKLAENGVYYNDEKLDDTREMYDKFKFVLNGFPAMRLHNLMINFKDHVEYYDYHTEDDCNIVDSEEYIKLIKFMEDNNYGK